jgi:hypothetical protein
MSLITKEEFVKSFKLIKGGTQGYILDQWKSPHTNLKIEKKYSGKQFIGYVFADNPKITDKFGLWFDKQIQAFEYAYLVDFPHMKPYFVRFQTQYTPKGYEHYPPHTYDTTSWSELQGELESIGITENNSDYDMDKDEFMEVYVNMYASDGTKVRVRLTMVKDTDDDGFNPHRFHINDYLVKHRKYRVPDNYNLAKIENLLETELQKLKLENAK